MPLQNLKVDPYKYQFFKKSDLYIYQSAQFGAKFWAKSPNFSKIFLKLSQFGSNLRKFWKIGPFIYQILHFIRGHSYTKRLILLAMLAAHPHRVFCTEYPPGGRSFNTWHWWSQWGSHLLVVLSPWIQTVRIPVTTVRAIIVGRTGCPPKTSDWEIYADLLGKKRQGRNVKLGIMERKRRKIVKGKMEIGKKNGREGGKVSEWGEDLFCFSFLKWLKFVLGLPKWKFSAGKKHFTPGKKIRKNDFAPSEKNFLSEGSLFRVKYDFGGDPSI